MKMGICLFFFYFAVPMCFDLAVTRALVENCYTNLSPGIEFQIIRYSLYLAKFFV